MNPPVILVAIDLAGGQVVRLLKGDMGQKTVYAQDPVETALEWERKGARWLHLVDLDGATGSGRSNEDPIRRILDAASVPVQIGGGIRTMDAIQRWISRGASRVCIGTRSMDRRFLTEAAKEFGDRLVASLDARAGRVRVGGWTRAGGAGTLDALERMLQAGAPRVMFTDIERDGTLEGPNLHAIEQVLEAAAVPVITAGGVARIGDIEKLAPLASKGLEGIVIGKALYSGDLDLSAAQAVLAA